MAFVDDLAAYLASQSLGTVGTDIYKLQLPPDAEGLLLIPYGGAESDPVHLVDNPRVQVTARYLDAATALAKAQAVYDLLDLQESVQMGGADGSHATDCRALQPPFSLGQDERQMWRIVFNIRFLVRK